MASHAAAASLGSKNTFNFEKGVKCLGMTVDLKCGHIQSRQSDEVGRTEGPAQFYPLGVARAEKLTTGITREVFTPDGGGAFLRPTDLLAAIITRRTHSKRIQERGKEVGATGAAGKEEKAGERGVEVGERDKVRRIGDERWKRKEPEKRGDGKWSRSLASIDGWDWPWQGRIREK